MLDGNNGLETYTKETAPGEDHTRDFSKEFLALTNAMDGYADKELGVKNLGPYYAVTPNIMRMFDQWNFITTGATSLDVTLGKVLKDSPLTRVFVLQGATTRSRRWA